MTKHEHMNPDGSTVTIELGDHATIGDRAKIGADAKIGAGATIGDWAKIGAGATIGDRAKIGADAKIGTGESLHGYNGRFYWDVYQGQLRYGCLTQPLKAWAGHEAELCAQHDPDGVDALRRVVRVAQAFCEGLS